MVSSSIERMKDKERKREFHKHLHSEIHNSSQFQEENPSGLGRETAETGATGDGDANILTRARVEEIQGRFAGAKEHESFNAREFLQLLRWERDEAVRRELAVGTGPEVRRS
jgi:hypothetical protein